MQNCILQYAIRSPCSQCHFGLFSWQKYKLVDVASPHVVVFIHSTLHYGHSNQEFIIMKGAKGKQVLMSDSVILLWQPMKCHCSLGNQPFFFTNLVMQLHLCNIKREIIRPNFTVIKFNTRVKQKFNKCPGVINKVLYGEAPP